MAKSTKKKASKKTPRHPRKSPEQKLREQLEAERLDLLIRLQSVPAEGHRSVEEHIQTLELQHRVWVVQETWCHLVAKHAEALEAQRAAKGVSECLVRATKARIADRIDQLEEEIQRQQDNASELAALH